MVLEFQPQIQQSNSLRTNAFSSLGASIANLLKGFVILSVIGAHKAIPNIKVQAVITAEIFVMHVMMRACIVPESELAFGKSFRQNLIA